MVSEKALYWTAAAVMALGISSSYASKHQDWTNCTSERSIQIAQNVAARVISRAGTLLARAEARVGRGESVVARAQTRVVYVQNALAHRQNEIVQQQVQRQVQRMVQNATQKMTTKVVICSDQDTEDATPDAPGLDDNEN